MEGEGWRTGPRVTVDHSLSIADIKGEELSMTNQERKFKEPLTTKMLKIFNFFIGCIIALNKYRLGLKIFFLVHFFLGFISGKRQNFVNYIR